MYQSLIQLRSNELVSTEFFRNTGEPVDCGLMRLEGPPDEQYILRMAIRADGGSYLLPEELNWIRPMLIRTFMDQGRMEADHPFCYVTVRHGLVKSETDDEWHVDGFSTKVPHVPEQNYTWCSDVGTEYSPLNILVPEDFDPLVHNINHYLQQHMNTNNVWSCRSQRIYCFDPYIIHRRPPATAGMMRTFVRISFVPIEINDINNTQNPLLPRVYNADGVAYRNKLLTY